MRLYTNVPREKDYRALAPRLGVREVNIGNQHADDKGLAEIIPMSNKALWLRRCVQFGPSCLQNLSPG